MNCVRLGLPEPVGDAPITNHEVENVVLNQNVLNSEQRRVFNNVIQAAEQINRGMEVNDRLFYLDAPGGSGKTFLFNMIHDHLSYNNIITQYICVDWNSSNSSEKW